MEFPPSTTPLFPAYDMFQYIELCGPEQRKFIEMLNWAQFDPRRNLLIAFAGGHVAEQLSTLPDQQVANELFSQLKLMFGSDLPLYTMFTRTSW